MFGFAVSRENGAAQVTDRSYPLVLKRSLTLSITLHKTNIGGAPAIGGGFTGYVLQPGDMVFLEPSQGLSAAVWTSQLGASGIGEDVYITASSETAGVKTCNVFIFSPYAQRGAGTGGFGVEVRDQDGVVTFSNKDYVAGILKAFLPSSAVSGDKGGSRVAVASCILARYVWYDTNLYREFWAQGVRFDGSGYSIRAVGEVEYGFGPMPFDTQLTGNGLTLEAPVVFVDVSGMPLPFSL